MRRSWHLFVAAAIVLMFGLALPPVSVRGDDSVTVQVSVDAGEDFGNPLTYQWRATDGHIVDQNAATTDWTLAKGPGIHFAYVLVSNGKGGYTEGRIAVNTDSNPTTTMVPRDQYPVAPPVLVPSPPSSSANAIKGTVILDDASICGTRDPFFGVDVTAKVRLEDNNGNVLSQAVLNPYAYGQFAIDDNPSGSRLVFTCENATLTATSFRNDPSTNFFIIRRTAQPEIKSVSATLNGSDIPMPPGVPPGILPSDYLAGRGSDNLIGPAPRFLAFKGLDTRVGSCQYYKSVGAVEDCDAAGNYQGATLTFDEWRKAVQIDEFCTPRPLCQQLPFQASAVFLNKTDLNLTRDHHSVEIAPSQSSAMPGQLGAYVCNHPGPAPNPDSDPTGLFQPTPSAAVDAAIDAVLQVDNAHPRGHNLIACVTMDRFPITSVTGQRVRGHVDEIFTRFLVFGPNGDLLPSANLDGDGEKFVPGACVACHGGTGYFALANAPSFNIPPASQPLFGGFPEGGVTEGADLFSYFLPYDVDNFAFHSTRQGFTKNDQQEAIYWLNSNALDANRGIAETNFGVQNSPQETAFNNLFNGWYSPGIHVFNSRTYVPTSVYSNSEGQSFYLNVIAPSCRTCHIAMDQANFDLADPGSFFPLNNIVCGQSLAASAVDPSNSELSYLMPNSRTTFDRFWLSGRKFVVGLPANTVNQPETLSKHYNSLSCHLP